MSIRAFVIFTLLVALGCGEDAPPGSRPPPSGTYGCADAECPAAAFTIHDGDFDNDDVRCGALVHGGRIYLSCPAGQSISASWRVSDDGTVTTDIIDVVYGEFESGDHRYRRTP